MDALKFLFPDTGKRYFYSLTQNCVPASGHSHKSQCNPGAIRMVCNAFRSHSGNCVFSGELRAVWFPLDWRKRSNVHRTTNVNSSVGAGKTFFGISVTKWKIEIFVVLMKTGHQKWETLSETWEQIDLISYYYYY